VHACTERCGRPPFETLVYLDRCVCSAVDTKRLDDTLTAYEKVWDFERFAVFNQSPRRLDPDLPVASTRRIEAAHRSSCSRAGNLSGPTPAAPSSKSGPGAAVSLSRTRPTRVDDRTEQTSPFSDSACDRHKVGRHPELRRNCRFDRSGPSMERRPVTRLARRASDAGRRSEQGGPVPPSAPEAGLLRRASRERHGLCSWLLQAEFPRIPSSRGWEWKGRGTVNEEKAG